MLDGRRRHYAIHLTERFREELHRVGDAVDALSRAAGGTGVALLTSSASSIAGFTVMAFAPMPLFAPMACSPR